MSLELIEECLEDLVAARDKVNRLLEGAVVLGNRRERNAVAGFQWTSKGVQIYVLMDDLEEEFFELRWSWKSFVENSVDVAKGNLNDDDFSKGLQMMIKSLQRELKKHEQSIRNPVAHSRKTQG